MTTGESGADERGPSGPPVVIGAGPALQAALGGTAAEAGAGRIPFNKPYLTGRELYNIARAVSFENIAGDGYFTQECSRFLETRFDVGRALMVTSCTAALEMAVMLCDLQPGDEIIVPSFTFVSTASAVIRAGGTPVFADIRPETLNIDVDHVEQLITDRTRALLPIHYAGVGCEMDRVMALADAYDLVVIEDAAQGVNAAYRGQALGSIAQLGCYSFHETKNFVCGEGGALAVNDPALIERAEILRDKGTNRRQFWRGEVDKYTWVDLGSSFAPSEISCAFLLAQFEAMDSMQDRRDQLWTAYLDRLKPLEADGAVTLPTVPADCRSNSHIFYVLMPDGRSRDGLIADLAEQNIHATFHYVPLHSSPMGRQLTPDPVELPVTDDIAARLVRLPMYYELSEDGVDRVCSAVTAFCAARR
ncbi:MAG: dTDP-4-amino-4,6-dideoxygalactose transaminase [Acidimicrobiia bacterium]|nr:dTDP-4-amino-4,6-dideoxygalactose transaminase [Acidimicrobiia bacterium]